MPHKILLQSTLTHKYEALKVGEIEASTSDEALQGVTQEKQSQESYFPRASQAKSLAKLSLPHPPVYFLTPD